MTAAVQPQYLRQLSHELRTPLTGIRGYSEVLEQAGPLTERQRHMLTMLDSWVRAIAEQHGGSVATGDSELRVALPRTVRPSERVVVRAMRRPR
ncbi:histidine kinase dimerization/phospho-acceptor domain-containing protein [Dactylosporangium sp. NPDC050588]|uniref:histidine kinase dimerization/phospho-acceptor domain-containing protein n=1 Tax=Dactylosporangium sp. NPDC050588 TaxID=3157211 RepID=UPI00341023FB